MDKLISLVPHSLKLMVGDSSPHDLPSTSSSLLDFFLKQHQFHQVIRDLADPEKALCVKNKNLALEFKEKGNQCHLSGDHPQALISYSQALRMAPFDADDMDRNLVATLYVNRASSLHKMGLLMECLRDCNRALQISSTYAKAWYRRGKVNASLENYQDAVRDLTIAQSMESSLGGKRQIESERKIILDTHKTEGCTPFQHNEKQLGISDEPHQVKPQCVEVTGKGRGMVSQSDIPQATLVHIEEPYALIILKHCRETHCHYCLNELPADTVPCTSCSIPFYCSQHCQVQAGGQRLRNCPKKLAVHGSHFYNLEDYIGEITLSNDYDPDVEHLPEHIHECQGVHWPLVLPSDVVLAGRIIVKSIKQKKCSKKGSIPLETLDLSHSYSKMSPESKLELHIYSIVLLCCLQHSSHFGLSVTGVHISQTVILISQIRVNSMAVVRMKSCDVNVPPYQIEDFIRCGRALTSSVEQVRVGQAVYFSGSLFNHSCQPNVHAYFLSRTLFIRTTEVVATGYPLELSYGPQVGQWDCTTRVKFLEDNYFFRYSCVINYERQKLEHFLEVSITSSLESNLEVRKLKDVDISKVAHFSFEEKNSSLHIDPGYCLKCVSYCDLESSREALSKPWNYIGRLQDSVLFKEISGMTLSGALESLDLLRSILHAYNKRIAEAEDNLAQAFCLVGDLQSAKGHCEASLKILEKLYDPNHVVIGYELVKLSSIQLSLGDSSVVDSIDRLSAIFSRYYGSHVDIVFPYLQSLQKEGCKLVQSGAE
ncbi:TPR_1 domain-containing protein/TPR_10 domain-containing protein/TPR_11 domain-containing protein [Cephalotus follicularis]|uniref:TPR_1 domain-containing protein/TPR_10 domain-containing protein/TPR_11 domain-containing protein n=1 Tax=Cephalotus follicularis TaxID=3775 RepID=A0A1Q3BQP0_CEPFO|nr:TPR_1 domain-containing protein/TPR_10 domain-containing protein/TPR_11 domain-containing protein [Cephalotus follicularis]